MTSLGLIASKNSHDEMLWLLSFINADGEPYQRGKLYDVVWFFDLTQEIKFIKRNTTSKIFAVAPEPKSMWPLNYDPDLIDLCDYYLGYENFSSTRFTGVYQKFFFFASTLSDIRKTFIESIEKERDVDFCIFARHDPNIRTLIAEHLKGENSIIAGPLFDNPQTSKTDIQVRCKYEFITENERNDYYLSEKIYQSLMCGTVPIYYGCRKVKEIIPPELFIDFGDFMVDDFSDAISSIIKYCKSDDNYLFHSSAIKKKALPFLESFASIESSMTNILNEYLYDLEKNNFTALKINPLFNFAKSIKHFLKRL